MSSSTAADVNLEKEPSRYRRLYARIEAMASSPYALWAMLAVSVVDGSVFPIPPFALLVPMVLTQPSKWWRFAIWGTVASMFGGVIGYFLGVALHQGVLTLLAIDLNTTINVFGEPRTLSSLLADNFLILALLCSVLPTPFKVVAIGSGLVSVPLPVFLLAALIGRTVRFFLIAGVIAYFGPKARRWLRV
jgi:membrane protein YqaA with SNARE-associated domain